MQCFEKRDSENMKERRKNYAAKEFSGTVHFLQFPNIEFPIFVYKFLQLFPTLCFSNSSNFQRKIVISVAASPLNKG